MTSYGYGINDYTDKSDGYPTGADARSFILSNLFKHLSIAEVRELCDQQEINSRIDEEFESQRLDLKNKLKRNNITL